jgi:predicted nuclease of restriction endonuclease-like (RecB) superfamily
MNLLLNDIRIILSQARNKAYSAINHAMVEAYWQIGKRIVKEEQKGRERAEYGAKLLQEVSKQLTIEFGRGFSEANLKNFRQFYLTFSEKRIRYAVRSELSWTHYRLIMRVENTDAMEYYINEATEQNWSTRQLERNINSFYYERLLSTKNKSLALKESDKMEKSHVADIIKDPLVLEFLNLSSPPSFSEQKLETAIINNLQQFLLEMGKGFSFVGRQYRISTETKHFFIDLVFYNYLLKCFVLIDLKIGELTHQDIGQMDMYIRLFEDQIKGKDDNPTIGIILCSEKDQTIVKYSVLKENKKLFASRYMLVLPSEKELQKELEREKHLYLNEKTRK